MPPKPLLTNDQAKQDFMIVMSAGGMLLEQFAHCSGVQVFIDLGFAVKKDLGHPVAYSTSKPVIHDIHCKSALWPV